MSKSNLSSSEWLRGFADSKSKRAGLFKNDTVCDMYTGIGLKMSKSNLSTSEWLRGFEVKDGGIYSSYGNFVKNILSPTCLPWSGSADSKSRTGGYTLRMEILSKIF